MCHRRVSAGVSSTGWCIAFAFLFLPFEGAHERCYSISEPIDRELQLAPKLLFHNFPDSRSQRRTNRVIHHVVHPLDVEMDKFVGERVALLFAGEGVPALTEPQSR